MNSLINSRYIIFIIELTVWWTHRMGFCFVSETLQEELSYLYSFRDWVMKIARLSIILLLFVLIKSRNLMNDIFWVYFLSIYLLRRSLKKGQMSRLWNSFPVSFRLHFWHFLSHRGIIGLIYLNFSISSLWFEVR